MNNVCLMGRITADPELKQTTTGVNVCSFTLAVDNGKIDADGNRGAYFFNCIAWRKSAEFVCKFFRKGDMMGVTGELTTRQYKDKDTGKNRTVVEVNVVKTSFAGGKKESSNQPQAQPQNSYASALVADGFEPVASDDGDLPF